MAVNFQYITPVLAFIGLYFVTSILCADATSYGNSGYYSNNNPWQRSGSQSSSQYQGYPNNNPWNNYGHQQSNQGGYVSNNNPWNNYGRQQQPVSQGNFWTSTPWPALGANSGSTIDYGRALDRIAHGLVNVRTTYYDPVNNATNFQSRNSRGRYNYNNRYGSSSGPAGSTNTNNQFRNPVQDVSDNDLRQFSEDLLKKDENNAAEHITVNYQGRTSSRSQNDEAPLPLITVNSAQVYNIPTIKKLKKLYDNYELHTNVREDHTQEEINEEEDLIDAILSTPVMEHTRDFLIQKGRISSDPNEFKNLLKDIWFNMYTRGSSRVSSSGFEHVYVAEVRNNQVSGCHNWVFFNEEEKNDKADYLGYMRKIEFGDKGAILKLHFKYSNVDKPVGSMFIGTSPEFEMALYSTCFLLRADRVCPLKLGNNRFIIRTFTYRYRGKNLIGSAFPEI